jgi:hypothetical protein
MAEQQVSLEGLPEPVARAIEVAVRLARTLTGNVGRERRPTAELPKWNLGVKGTLRRAEIYDDRG